MRILVILFVLMYCDCHSQELQVPKGYQLKSEIKGDLDKDGIEERVVVYNMREIPKDSFYAETDRHLIIYKLTNGIWKEWRSSKTAVKNSADGGMMGDPFGEISIRNGVLEIYHEGGSSWKWNTRDKYRFQNNEFELIGYHSFGGKNCEEWEEVDFNLSTGKFFYKKEFERCEDEGDHVIYKKMTETFYRKGVKINLNNRYTRDIIYMTPKYKQEIYIDSN